MIQKVNSFAAASADRRKWQPAPVFLPGEFHGQRCLVGYSPRGSKEPDMTEQRSTHPQTEKLDQWLNILGSFYNFWKTNMCLWSQT